MNGPYMNCCYCYRAIRVPSKRIGLKHHIKEYHPEEFNRCVQKAAEGNIAGLEQMSVIKGAELTNSRLLQKPFCPCCEREISVSTSNDFGLHVIKCSGQQEIIEREATIGEVFCAQFNAPTTSDALRSLELQREKEEELRLAELERKKKEVARIRAEFERDQEEQLIERLRKQRLAEQEEDWLLNHTRFGLSRVPPQPTPRSKRD